MGERNQQTSTSDSIDDFFEPALMDGGEEEFEEAPTISSEKRRLAEMRRRAEQRLEERRLRDELGYYDLHLDNY